MVGQGGVVECDIKRRPVDPRACIPPHRVRGGVGASVGPAGAGLLGHTDASQTVIPLKGIRVGKRKKGRVKGYKNHVRIHVGFVLSSKQVSEEQYLPVSSHVRATELNSERGRVIQLYISSLPSRYITVYFIAVSTILCYCSLYAV